MLTKPSTTSVLPRPHELSSHGGGHPTAVDGEASGREGGAIDDDPAFVLEVGAQGFEALVEADDAGSMVPNLDLVRGVKVFVKEVDLAEAYEVLERMLPSGDPE